MEDATSTLVPLILNSLSRMPHFCDTLDHLYSELEEEISKGEEGQRKYARKQIERALSVAETLGIITITSDTASMDPSLELDKELSMTEVCPSFRDRLKGNAVRSTSNPPSSEDLVSVPATFRHLRQKSYDPREQFTTVGLFSARQGNINPFRSRSPIRPDRRHDSDTHFPKRQGGWGRRQW